MKRGGYLPRRTPLRPVGAKTKRDRDELRAARLVLLERSGGRCEARGFSPLCTGVGVHPHHIIRRSAGGGNDPEVLLWVCAHCHAAIHDRPAEALVAGFLKPGWTR